MTNSIHSISTSQLVFKRSPQIQSARHVADSILEFDPRRKSQELNFGTPQSAVHGSGPRHFGNGWRFELGGNPLGGRFAAVDAVGHAGAAVGVASQRQAWQARDPRLGLLGAGQMTEV